MKIISISIVLLVLSSKLCQGEPSKTSNGSIVWDPLPSLGSFKVDPDQFKNDGNRPATLADMSSGWVDFIQPKGFPIDYVVHLVELAKSDWSNQSPVAMDEVLMGMSSFIGIIICFLIGILFFLLLPLIALFFFCCRCCDNCGGKREQENSNLCCKQISLSIGLAVSLAVLCAGAVCIDTSNKFMTTAKDSSFQTSVDVVGDLQTFVDGSIKQASHILEDEYRYTEALILSDLQNVGALIGEPIQNYLLDEVKVQTLFDELENLINDLNDTSVTLQRMNTSRHFLIASEEYLSYQLQNVSDTLDAINTTCIGCVPPNNGLAVNVNFTWLPDLDDQINGADFAVGNITYIYNQGVEAINQIPQAIENATREPISDIESVIIETSDSIDEIYTQIEDQLSSLSDTLSEYSDLITDRLDVADEYLAIRDYTILVLALVGFLIFAIFVVGLIMGSVFSRDVDPRERSSASNCCGNFLMFGVVLTFLLTPLLMLVTSLLFLTLAPISLTCQPLKSLQLINETIDQPDLISDGYWLGDLVLGNSSIPLTVTSILEECNQNSSIYSAVQLKHVIDVNELQKIIKEVRNQTDQLLDEIDIGDFDLSDLIPNNLEPLLNFAMDEIQLEQIDFITLDTLLQESVTTDDLDGYATALDIAADDNPLVADDLYQAAANLRQIQQDGVQIMEDTMASMLSDTNHIQALIPILELDVNETVKAGAVVESNLNDTAALENELDSSVSDYVDVVIGYMEQYIDIAVEQLVDEFGRCYPLRAIYDATVNVICHYDLDSLNTLWFSLGWIVFWVMVSLIFAVKLAKYLRRMDSIKISNNQVDRVRAYSEGDIIDGLNNHDDYGYHSNQHEGHKLTFIPGKASSWVSAYPPTAPPAYEECKYCHLSGP